MKFNRITREACNEIIRRNFFEYSSRKRWKTDGRSYFYCINKNGRYDRISHWYPACGSIKIIKECFNCYECNNYDIKYKLK